VVQGAHGTRPPEAAAVWTLHQGHRAAVTDPKAVPGVGAEVVFTKQREVRTEAKPRRGAAVYATRIRRPPEAGEGSGAWTLCVKKGTGGDDGRDLR
jgi:hypothetical protein